MNNLRAELLRKRKLLEEAGVLGKQGTEIGKKYVKRADLEAKLAPSGTTVKDERKGDSSRESTPDSSARRAREKDANKIQTDHGDDVKIPRKEVIRRLRERNEPIRVFGETDEEAMERLKDLEIREPELDIGFRNDFKAAMDKIDIEFMNDMAKGQSSNNQAATDIKIKDDGTTLEDIQKLAADVAKNENPGREVIIKFMEFIMRKWAEELNRRSVEEKQSVKGKLDRGTYVQTEDYLKSLFQKLRNKSLQDDITQSLLRIIVHLLERDYVKANEVFLQMAIGNAPWPIGVTAVGIHSRPGREKVFSQMIAHVLNDETQRKYIQGFKRLITKMQQLFPTDPSHSVEYEALKLNRA